MSSEIVVSCVEMVYPRERWGAFHPHRCQRKGVVERNGNAYCKLHDPEAVKARSDKSMERFQEEARRERRKHEDAVVGRWLRNNEPMRYAAILEGTAVSREGESAGSNSAAPVGGKPEA